MLRPQDVAVAVLLAMPSAGEWTYASLANRLRLSTSETHAAVRRARLAGLVRGRQVDRRALFEFLEHGVRYAFYGVRGAPTRGIPTGISAPPLNEKMLANDGPVWPWAEGTARGYELEPLYRAAPQAARQDPALHEVFALIDAIRDGGVREREVAIRELRTRLDASESSTEHA